MVYLLIPLISSAFFYIYYYLVYVEDKLCMFYVSLIFLVTIIKVLCSIYAIIVKMGSWSRELVRCFLYCLASCFRGIRVSTKG